MGLNLEMETFTSCAVLNAKHVSAYCRARLSALQASSLPLSPEKGKSGGVQEWVCQSWL